ILAEHDNLHSAVEHPRVNYPAVLSTEGTYTLISFPNCPGCRTYAQPGEDVIAIAQDALAGWLETATKVGKEPQPPTLPAELSATERLVQVPVPPHLARQLEPRTSQSTRPGGDGRHSTKQRIAPRGQPPSRPDTPESE